MTVRYQAVIEARGALLTRQDDEEMHGAHHANGGQPVAHLAAASGSLRMLCITGLTRSVVHLKAAPAYWNLYWYEAWKANERGHRTGRGTPNHEREGTAVRADQECQVPILALLRTERVARAGQQQRKRLQESEHRAPVEAAAALAALRAQLGLLETIAAVFGDVRCAHVTGQALGHEDHPDRARENVHGGREVED